jgi:hypothetical protein
MYVVLKLNYRRKGLCVYLHLFLQPRWGREAALFRRKSLWYPLDIRQREARSLPRYSSGKGKTFTETAQFIILKNARYL